MGQAIAPDPGNYVARTDSSSGSKQAKNLELFFGSLDKAIRGNRLYQGEGQIVDKQLAELVTRAEAVVDYSAVTVKVTPFGVTFDGETVTPPDQRIPYLFRLF